MNMEEFLKELQELCKRSNIALIGTAVDSRTGERDWLTPIIGGVEVVHPGEEIRVFRSIDANGPHKMNMEKKR
jgi:hypothetical protein